MWDLLGGPVLLAPSLRRVSFVETQAGISPAGPWQQHKNRGQPTRRQTASCQCPFSSNPINAQVEQHFSERPTKFSVRSIWFQHVWKVYPCNYQLSEIYMAFAGGSRLIKTQSYAARWPHCL
jgi:hypothetical protein